MQKSEKIPEKTSRGFVSVPERIKFLDKTEKFAVLATVDNGQPYTSLVNFVFTPDCSTIFFATPRATKKYRNITKTKSVSLLIDSRSGKAKNLLKTEALTVIGEAHPLRKGKFLDDCKKIFLAKHPELKGFVNARSTALVAVDIVFCVHASRFQTITVWDCRKQ